MEKDHTRKKKWPGRPKVVESVDSLDEKALERQDLRTLIGVRIRLRRQTAGMTQKELADYVGVSTQQLQKYENARNRIGAETLFQIAEALGVPFAWLVEDMQMNRFVMDNNMMALADRVSEGFVQRLAEKVKTSENNTPLNEEDVKLLGMFHRLKTKQAKRAVLQMLQVFLENSGKLLK